MENKNRKTYCNPLSIPSIPRGTDGWQIMDFTGEEPSDYRSISDPSVLYENGRWYLYPSYGMAYVSNDFTNWKHIRTTPYDMKYSPVVVPFRGRYLMTSHSHGLYVSDSPLGDFEYTGDFILPDEKPFRPVDPALFVDDDGRLYLYFFMMEKSQHKRAFISGSCGVELDGDDPRRMKDEPVILSRFDRRNVWERFGEHNQDTLCGWVEGQWMFKRNGRYYLIYASSGTEYTNYCMAAYDIDLTKASYFVIFIPAVGFVGRMLYPLVYRLTGQKEHIASLFGFVICLASSVPLCFGVASPVAAMVCLGLVYAAVSVINTSLLSIYPIRFVPQGRVATVSGMMDFSTYLGAGISSSVYGFLVSSAGYPPMYGSWAVVSALSALSILLFLVPRKKRENSRKGS